MPLPFNSTHTGAQLDSAVDTVLHDLGTAALKDAGVANGVATLDSGGKVPTSQLPAAILGALDYQGTWNANTNTPTLASGVGTKGYYYKVSVAGTTTIDGISEWNLTDWIVFDGTVWDKVDNSEEDATATVKGRVKLAGDLTGGTADSPQVSGLGGSALPSNVSNGFLKRNNANNAWEEVAYGSGSNTVCQGNDSRLSDARNPTGSGTMTGLLTLNGGLTLGASGLLINTHKALTFSSTTNVDWTAGLAFDLTVTGNLTITNSGMVAGQVIKLFLTADSSGPYTLAWPAWKVMGAALPTSLPASKSVIVTLESTGTTTGSVFATAIAQV